MRKIKHWAKYGTVMAERVKDNSCTLHVRVVGNHERGLNPHWSDSAYRWLVHRFDKSAPVYYNDGCMSCRVEESYLKENGLYVDCCDFMFTYPKGDW